MFRVRRRGPVAGRRSGPRLPPRACPSRALTCLSPPRRAPFATFCTRWPPRRPRSTSSSASSSPPTPTSWTCAASRAPPCASPAPPRCRPRRTAPRRRAPPCAVPHRACHPTHPRTRLRAAAPPCSATPRPSSCAAGARSQGGMVAPRRAALGPALAQASGNRAPGTALTPRRPLSRSLPLPLPQLLAGAVHPHRRQGQADLRLPVPEEGLSRCTRLRPAGVRPPGRAPRAGARARVAQTHGPSSPLIPPFFCGRRCSSQATPLLALPPPRASAHNKPWHQHRRFLCPDCRSCCFESPASSGRPIARAWMPLPPDPPPASSAAARSGLRRSAATPGFFASSPSRRAAPK